MTAADLAHAQGFHDCAQLLSNAHNQLNQINGFAHNGTDHSHIQGRSLLNGIANRKRLLDCAEPNHVKKARTESMNFPVKAKNGIGEELESMNVESTAENQSGGTGPSPPMSVDLEHHEDSVSLRNPSPTQKMLEPTSVTSVPGPWLWTNSYAYL